MILFDQDPIVSRFADMPFKINGVGMFREKSGQQIVMMKYGDEYVAIGLDERCNGGYLRSSGEVILGNQIDLTCSTWYYKARTDIVLVIGLLEGDMSEVMDKVLYRASLVSQLRLVRMVEKRETILREEFMKESQMRLMKFVFEYSFFHFPNTCDAALTCPC